MPAFALSGIFVRIYNASDSVILGYLRDNTAVGLFSIPAKVVTAFQALIPGALTATIYPSMSNFYVTSQEKLKKLFERSFNYLSLASVPVALGLYIIAEPIIHLLWPKYIEVVPTFQVMALAVPFIFLAFPTGLLLRACDKQNINTINRGIIMVLSIVLNIILVYCYGVFGAGVTFLIVNIVLLVADLVYVGKIIDYDAKAIISYNLRVIFAGAVMAAAVWASLKFIPFYAAIAVGIIVFLGVVLAMGVVRKSEIDFFKSCLKFKRYAADGEEKV
jgi:O-antigen/teichoic acid export membrane protein